LRIDRRLLPALAHGATPAAIAVITWTHPT
jgi:hypothetical protein